MKPVTQWYKLNPKTNIYEKFCIDNDHSAQDNPMYLGFPQEKFRKQFGYLNDKNEFIPMIT